MTCSVGLRRACIIRTGQCSGKDEELLEACAMRFNLPASVDDLIRLVRSPGSSMHARMQARDAHRYA